MQSHLEEVSRLGWRSAAAALFLDRTGWHTSDRLIVPKSITLVFLPSRARRADREHPAAHAPELANCVFETDDAIVEAARKAWRNLVAAPTIIISIGRRDWLIPVKDESHWHK